MEKEIEDYLLRMTRLLNGQLRGAINFSARIDNQDLITLTLNDVFETGYNLGKAVQESGESLEKLKIELGIKNEQDDTDRPEG
jgi:hypothetical protein